MCVGFLGQELSNAFDNDAGDSNRSHSYTERESSVEFNSRVSQSFCRSHPIALVVAPEITSFVVVVGPFC